MGNGEKKLIHTLHVPHVHHVVPHTCSTCTVPSTHIRLCTHA